MAKSVNIDKSEKIFNVLERYRLHLSDEISDEYKCVICGNVIINAFQGNCGCNYCKRCVDGNGVSGIGYDQPLLCPGSGEECGLSLIAEAQRDYRMNKQIAQLMVTCPFGDLDCLKYVLISDLWEHLQSHEAVVVDSNTVTDALQPIGQIDSNYYQQRIDKLESQLTSKEYLIDQMREEIQLIKNEQQELANEMALLKPAIDNKINEISAELANRTGTDHYDEIRSEINLIKEDRQKLIRGIERINHDVLEKFDLEIKGKLRIIQSEIEANSEMRMTKLYEREQMNQLDLEKRLSEIEKNLNLIDGIFVWKINRIEEIKKCGYIWSEYFYSSVNSYRQRLRLDAYGDHLWIRLCVYSSPADLDLDWPFNAEVTIKLASKLWPNSGKTITKHCTIDKPIFGSCECSEEFTFSYSDFITNGLTLNDVFFVECHIRQ